MGGGTATNYFRTWLESKKLLKSSIRSEVLLAARAIDALVEDRSGADTINLFVLELLARRLYTFEKAFEAVTEERDWRLPKGQEAKGWRSKVKWSMLDIYDIQALEKDGAAIESVDNEASALADASNRYNAFTTRVGAQASSSDQLPLLLASDDS